MNTTQDCSTAGRRRMARDGRHRRRLRDCRGARGTESPQRKRSGAGPSATRSSAGNEYTKSLTSSRTAGKRYEQAPVRRAAVPRRRAAKTGQTI